MIDIGFKFFKGKIEKKKFLEEELIKQLSYEISKAIDKQILDEMLCRSEETPPGILEPPEMDFNLETMVVNSRVRTFGKDWK